MSELENRMLALRDATSQLRLDRTKPVVVMLDGRSFSKLIKNRFQKPFDPEFMAAMDATAAYVLKNVQGAQLGYVQSDEISFYIDSTDELSTPFFEFRLCKLLSIIPSMATGRFNEILHDRLKKPVEFDCKAWNVNDWNDVYAWFLYRQLDCIRNSKQQAAQTYLSHKDLVGLNTDTQVQKLMEEKGINWNDYTDGEKFGRFIWKETEHYQSLDYGEYDRSVWKSHPGWELSKDRERLMKMIEP